MSKVSTILKTTERDGERKRERERQTDRERNNKETPEKQNINNITSLPLLKFNG